MIDEDDIDLPDREPGPLLHCSKCGETSEWKVNRSPQIDNRYGGTCDVIGEAECPTCGEVWEGFYTKELPGCIDCGVRMPCMANTHGVPICMECRDITAMTEALELSCQLAGVCR